VAYYFLELNTVFYFFLVLLHFVYIFLIGLWLWPQVERVEHHLCEGYAQFLCSGTGPIWVSFSFSTLGFCSLLVFIYVWLCTLLLKLFLVRLISTSLLYSHLRFLRMFCGIILSQWEMSKWTMLFTIIQNKRQLKQWWNYWRRD